MSDKKDTNAQRLTRLETQQERVLSDVQEIRTDVKAILAYQNEQRGRARIGMMLLTGVVAVCGGLIGWLVRHLS